MLQQINTKTKRIGRNINKGTTQMFDVIIKAIRCAV